MKNIIKEREKSTSHKCTRNNKYPKRGKLLIKCVGQGMAGEWEEGRGGGGMQLPFQMGG